MWSDIPRTLSDMDSSTLSPLKEIVFVEINTINMSFDMQTGEQ